MQLPEVDGRNYEKILRELDLSKFPSIPEFLKEIHYKLNKKIKLTDTEQLLSKSQLKKYFKDFKLEYNSFLLQNFDWSIFNSRPPFEFQKKGVEFLILNDKCILADDMGCIDGEAIININLNKNNHHKITFKELYLRFNNLIKQSDKWVNSKYYASCLIENENQFKLKEIEKVIFQGKKKVLKLILEDGKILKATNDHQFNKSGVWKELKDLKIGDEIYVNGNNLCKNCNSSEQLITYKYSKFHSDRCNIKKTIPKKIKILNIIDENEEIDVYDMTVSDAHNFIANGIVVHNCGKSIQSIMASKVLPDEYNIIIVTLKTLKLNFEEEIKYFDNRTSVINKKWNPNKYTIIHYESALKFKEEIEKCQFDVFILDECHKIRNRKTKRTEAFLQIFKNTKKEIKKIWLLTGTPFDNKPSEYYNLLRIIRHPVAENWISYIRKYCNAFQDMWGHWVTSGASNLEELHKNTKGSILRRTKKQVLVNFPNKSRKTIPLELENEKGYQKALQDYIDKKFILEEEELEENFETNDEILNFFGRDSHSKKSTVSQLSAITKIMIWRQWCAIEKIKDGSTLELIENELDKGNKVVVFTNFTAVIDLLKQKLGDLCITFDGRIKAENRQGLVNKFNKSEKPIVLVSNFAVGSTGLNLQSATVEIMNDLPYVPGTIIQGEDRIYRIGQNSDCWILYPYYKGTIEEKVYKSIIKKVDMISKVLDGISYKFLDDIDLPEEVAFTKEQVIKDILENVDSFNFYF